MTELIVTELPLRRFDGVEPISSPRPGSAAECMGDATHAPDHDRVERLAAHHSRRRKPPGELGL
ncbi:MAG TPA: hypothetical protein VIO13_04675 [Candidatus Dormibacteraeota bacterium]